MLGSVITVQTAPPSWLTDGGSLHPRPSNRSHPEGKVFVERWFGALTQKALRRGIFLSVSDLQEAIQSFLAAWNADPKPFVWTAELEDILEKIARARTKLESIQPGSTLPRRRQKREERICAVISGTLH